MASHWVQPIAEDTKNSSSSEDEIDILLHGTEKQWQKLMQRRSQRQRKESSSEDEFEKQMSNELNSTVQLVEAAHSRSFNESFSVTNQGTDLANKSAQPATSHHSERKSDLGKKQTEPEFYDNAYFDSDSDEEGTREEKKKLKRAVISNDDLLYDPEMDNEDQKWVDNQRRLASGRPANKRTKGDRMPRSDAVLNCPACMVTLCRDCQRHDIYKSQYRAMFVTNCKVLTDEVLKFPKGGKLSKNKKKKGNKSDHSTTEATSGEMETENQAVGVSNDPAGDEVYNPVKCEQCNTEVGVFDKDEVYHFFNVLASYT